MSACGAIPPARYEQGTWETGWNAAFAPSSSPASSATSSPSSSEYPLRFRRRTWLGVRLVSGDPRAAPPACAPTSEHPDACRASNEQEVTTIRPDLVWHWVTSERLQFERMLFPPRVQHVTTQ